ncbi:MAG TPA: hypothetical protein GX509_06430 [Firmicutes bacterium]|nr:hypothetical protein [Bacillota bacterium]
MDGLHTYNPVSLIAGGVDVSGVYSKVSGEVCDADNNLLPLSSLGMMTERFALQAYYR